jgi:hypothetical protein
VWQIAWFFGFLLQAKIVEGSAKRSAETKAAQAIFVSNKRRRL